MLTENDVVDKMETYFLELGCLIDKKCTTVQKGIDLIIAKPDGGKIYLEAKGETSARDGSKRHGKPFNNSQVHDHVASAIFSTLKNINKYSKHNSEFWIALPDTRLHRTKINVVSLSLKKLDIKVVFVSAEKVTPI
jgi:hypothetical protein